MTKKQKVYEQTYLLHCSKKQLLTEVARTPISQWKNCNYHVACLSSTRVSKLRSHLTCARRICCTDKTESIFFCHCFQKITLKCLKCLTFLVVLSSAFYDMKQLSLSNMKKESFLFKQLIYIINFIKKQTCYLHNK